MSDYTGPDHIVTVTPDPYHSYDADSSTWIEGIEHEVEHPAECDALKYGELCALDREIRENGFDYSGIPGVPGTYTVSYWSSGPDYFGEYDAGLTVEKRGEQLVEKVAEVMSNPWAVAP